MKTYHGLYRGIVEENVDEAKDGRLQVRVYGVFDNVTKSELPWAVPCWHGYAHWIPRKGDVVYVMFSGGNPNFPVWMGWCPTKGENPADCRTGATDKRVMIFETTNGKKIYVSDDSDDIIEITHDAGPTIKLENDLLSIKFDDSNYIEIDASGVRVKGTRIDWN